MTPSDAASAPRERLVFLDALRGFALILMVLNHTSRWWQDGSLRWSRYYFIYVTMAVAAPIFIFLVGFCLPLSLSHSRPAGVVGARPDDLEVRQARRADHRRGPPLEPARVPGRSLLEQRRAPDDRGERDRGRPGRAAARCPPPAAGPWSSGAVLIFLAFGWAYAPLGEWVRAHPGSSRVLFFEFPPWPWLALVLFALVPGDVFVKQPDRPSRNRYMARAAVLGALGVAWIFAYDGWADTPNRWTFKRDFILNAHWTPRGATAIWVIGMVFVLMALFYYVAEVRRVRVTWLVTLGQTALFLYFIHHFIVLTLVNQHLHWLFNNWWTFGAANLVADDRAARPGSRVDRGQADLRARLPRLAALGRA